MHYEFGELDLLDPELHRDPWPLYTWLREDARLYKDANGLWIVSRYDDIIAISRDPDTFTSTEGNRPLMPPDDSFIHLDGRRHKKRRAVIREWFGPPAMKLLEEHVRDAVTELIDEVITTGSCDFVDAIAGPLPVRLICEMTGIPADYMPLVKEWMEAFIPGGQGPLHVTESVNDAFFSFGALHLDLVDARQAEPRNDLLSLWIHTGVDGVPLTEDELLWEHTMLIVGGGETTRNAVAGGLWLLEQYPEQRAWLQNHPEGLSNAIDEMIRWVTPFTSMSRTVTRDVEMFGHTMRAGEEVMMLYPAANRDPRKFDNGDVFDIRRTFRNRHLAFGYGAHYCLGAHLAKLEATVTFQELFRRMPDWALAGEPVWSRSSFLRGPKKLPIGFTPGVRSAREAS